MSGFEIAQLRKALQRTRDQLKEEKEDHEYTQNRLVQLQAERDCYYSELILSRQTIDNVEQIIHNKMKFFQSRFQKKQVDMTEKIKQLELHLNTEKKQNQQLREENEKHKLLIQDLSNQLKEFSAKCNCSQVNIASRIEKSMNEKNFDSGNQQFQPFYFKGSRSEQSMELRQLDQNIRIGIEQIKISEKEELQETEIGEIDEASLKN